MEHVFVYGTLKRGEPNCITRFSPHVRFVGEAVAQGELRSHFIPYFLPYGAQVAADAEPALFTSHDEKVRALLPHIVAAPKWVDDESVPVVRGEVWAVPDDVVPSLDALEGVRRHRDGSVDPASCHYLPVRVTVKVAGRCPDLVVCLAYSFNVLSGYKDWSRLKPVPGGEYVY